MLLGVAHVFGEDLELMLTTAGVVLVCGPHSELAYWARPHKGGWQH